VTQPFEGFTANVDKVVENLGKLTADGGGDGPEAVSAALGEAVLRLKWRPDAVKIAVLITDAPPHGIGESGDWYPDGHAQEKDPLALARAMARRGITLLVIACEPTLSNAYEMAHDFYTALAKITAGSMIPLTDANILAPFLVGFAFEQVGIDSLVQELKDFVLAKAKEGTSQADIAKQVQDILKSRGQSLISADTTKGVYEEPPEAEQAVAIWMKAKTLEAGRDEILLMPSEPRVSKEFTPPSDLVWPKHPVSIRLQNLGNTIIEYQYPEDGVPKKGILDWGFISESSTTFTVNTPYLFSLRSGRKIVSTSRTFIKDDDWNLAVYFD